MCEPPYLQLMLWYRKSHFCNKGFLNSFSLTVKFCYDTKKMPAVCYWDLCSVFRVLLLFIRIYFFFCRKELILSGTLNPLKDLHLGKLALTKFPKSPETWIHRFVFFAFCCLSKLKHFS